jgi:hypothetical protein
MSGILDPRILHFRSSDYHVHRHELPQYGSAPHQSLALEGCPAKVDVAAQLPELLELSRLETQDILLICYKILNFQNSKFKIKFSKFNCRLYFVPLNLLGTHKSLARLFSISSLIFGCAGIPILTCARLPACPPVPVSFK